MGEIESACCLRCQNIYRVVPILRPDPDPRANRLCPECEELWHRGPGILALAPAVFNAQRFVGLLAVAVEAGNLTENDAKIHWDYIVREYSELRKHVLDAFLLEESVEALWDGVAGLGPAHAPIVMP